ncbi:acetate--CoA ligase family protein [Rhodoligotrophos appendicifer]|uniref:acetate--CoA ligase family protein n=1 Tax=Rhodoligotrophos appendicifer TaxID=987056 RepID=UPI00118602C0|nr:acetate--CoA ligase family protein [Rhodoligotrophos appendicifer]
METSLARALFSPRSVALIGASADANKHTSLPQRYLMQHGYQGAVFPINPRRSEIMGVPAFASVLDVGQPIDQAFIMVAAGQVPEVVEDCVRAGVRCATLLSAGFSEVGETGRRLQERIVETAQEGNLRLVGPNSLGMVNLPAGIVLTANEVLSLPTLPVGRNALISQSGSLLGALISRGMGRGIGFSKMVSVGNEADLGAGEIGAMLVDDPDTDAILLFLETIRKPDALRAMAARAHEVGKPVIAFRLGRSPLGEQLAMSHTGALSANGAAVDAFLADIGVVSVTQLETLIEMAPLVVGRKPAKGKRVAVMSTTGGGGGLIVDSLSARGIDVVAPDDDLVSTLAAKGITIGRSPLIDLTLAGTRADVYGTVLESLLASSHCDCVVAVVGSSAEFRPDRAVQPILGAAQSNGKPLAVFLTPQAERSHALLGAAGIASFRTPESCADAVHGLLDWRSPRARPGRGPDISAVEALLQGASGPLQPRQAGRVFARLGIAQPREVILPAAPLAAQDLPTDLSYPVVAKILSADIVHKTEAGGVILGIGSAAALAEAIGTMLATVAERAPTARLDGIQVQAQEQGLAEALVGYMDDPLVGPVVTVGMGGVLAEIYRDFTLRPAPVDMATAREMIAEIKGLAIIGGYRALPKGDVEGLAATIAAVSQLALVEAPRIAEAEINPVLIRAEGRGVVALDAFIAVTGEHR